MFKSKLAIIILSLASVIAFAQQPPGVHPSYVSITMKTDRLDSEPIETSVCGGIVADEKRRIIATAWHCVPNQRSAIERPGVFSVGGMDAKLVSFLSEADIALFQVADLKGLKAPNFKTLQKGDIVIASAYYDKFAVTAPMQDRYVPAMSVQVTLDWEGKVAAVAKANRRGGEYFDKITPTEYKWIIVTGNPAPGFSGGPVFDKENNFIGILSNINGGFTNISSSENVKAMIEKLN